MARTMLPAPQYGAASSKKRVTSSDLQQKTLNAGNEITVYSHQVPADKIHHWGYGARDRQASETSFVYADLVASGNGTGTAGDAVSGQLVLAVTDSTQEDVLARETFDSLEDLRQSANANLSERLMMPERNPAAGEDRHLELRIVADGGSDGVEIDPAASSAQVNYGVSDD